MPENKKEFLDRLEKNALAEKQGCYVFAMRSGKGFTPWYVGKATKTMRQECMTQDKLAKFARVFAAGIQGSPVMFFVVPEGTKNKVPKKICGEIESTKSVGELYAPVDGEIVEINDVVSGNPELVNHDPFGAGWLIKIRFKELPALLTHEEYAALTGEG